MVRERILDWVDEHPTPGTFPTNILYYRDGVGDSQLKDVKDIELKEINLAFGDAVTELKRKQRIPAHSNASVNITAIVVTKRHNTRFYPQDKGDKYENCHPGTHVDDVVTSPFYQDFYLQSHAALQGTARPAHYFIVQNDMNRSVDDLRQITHELCYSYVRATVGVSYAAPAYYADRLCERGRVYMRDFLVRTVAGEKTRLALEIKKHDKEQELRDARILTYGEERDDVTGRRRPKSLRELQQESDDKKVVEAECKKWAMDEAKQKFYKFGEGRNPWHKNVAKTMFWM